MEQNCSNKIISLHMTPCSFECHHVDVCYHRRKEILSNNIEGTLSPNFREEMLSDGYIIYESVCQLSILNLILLKTHSNYNITLPFQLVTKEILKYKDQVQISIYNEEQAKSLPNHQKLFLLKNDATFEYSKKAGLWNIPFSFMHFNVNQEWVTLDTLKDIVSHRLLSNVHSTTLDSCIENELLNGRCPYGHGNYIDITFDGTLRTCPFTQRGIPIKEVYDGTYNSLFKISHKSEKCKYVKWFGEVNGESKHTSI